MRNLRAIIFVWILSLFAFSAGAQTAADAVTSDAAEPSEYKLLSGEELLKPHMEITLEGVYSPGSHPLLPDGSPVTFTEFHHKDNTTTYKHRGYENYISRGVFIARKDRMCYMYNDPPRIVGRFCFFIFEKDDCYYHYFAGRPKPVTKDDFENWSSTAYRREDAQTCMPDVS